MNDKLIIDERRHYELYARRITERLTTNPRLRNAIIRLVMIAFDHGYTMRGEGKLTLEVDDDP